MNHSTKSITSTKPRYQSFYLKKLQTQTSLASEFQKDMDQSSQIIEREIQKIQRGLHKRNGMYSKALRRKSQIDEEEQRSRSVLKTRIDQKMRKSHLNMLESRQKSNSSLSSRLKAENKKIQQIKRLERTIYDDKYQKSKEMSTRTEKFFQDLKQRKKEKSNQISVDTSYIHINRRRQPLFSPISNKNFKMRQTSHEKSHHHLQENPENSRPNLSILRTPRQTILQKQKKKIQMQKSKQNSFLREYIHKLQNIEATRKKVKVEKKIPQSTAAKFINREYDDEEYQARKKFSKSSVKQAVCSKSSFSQLYKKKLQQKKEKKSFFLSQSIAQGDLLMKDNFKQTSKFKLNKLIRETQNELARKQNFRYMEKYLTKKF